MPDFPATGGSSSIPFCTSGGFAVTLINGNDSEKKYNICVSITPIPPTGTPNPIFPIIYTGATPLTATTGQMGPCSFMFTVTVPSNTTAIFPLSFLIRSFGTIGNPAGGFQLAFTAVDPVGNCPSIVLPVSGSVVPNMSGSLSAPLGFNNFIGVPSSTVSQNLIDGTIPPNGFQPPLGASVSDLVLTQDLIVDQTYTLNVRQIMIAPGKKIIVKSGKSLTLNSCQIFSCTQMNGGIKVETGASLCLNSCYISDSEYGVYAENGSSVGLLLTEFENDYIGVVCPNSPNNGQKVQFSGAFGGLFTNTFRTGMNNIFGAGIGLKMPYQGMQPIDPTMGFAGMQLTEQVVTLGIGNSFTSLANGIISDHTQLTIPAGNTFSVIRPNLISPVYPTYGYGVWHDGGKFADLDFTGLGGLISSSPTFSNVETGILSTKAKTTVKNAGMTMVDVGIQVEQCQNKKVDLNNNRISARFTGIKSQTNLPLASQSSVADNVITVNSLAADKPNASACVEMKEVFETTTNLNNWSVSSNTLNVGRASFGLWQVNAKNSRVIGNTVNLNDPLIANYEAMRIEGGKFHVIDNNLINNVGLAPTARGIEAIQCPTSYYRCNDVTQGFHRGLQIVSSSLNARVEGNDFSGADIGLALGEIGVSAVAVGPQRHKGNLWRNSQFNPITGPQLGQLGAANFGNPGDSPFFVDVPDDITVGDPDLMPNDVSPFNWFFNQTGSTGGCMGNAGDDGMFNGEPEDVLKHIAQGNLASASIHAAGFNTLADRQLYEKLQSGGILAQDPIMEAFLVENANGPIGQFEEVREQIGNLLILPSTMESQLTTIETELTVAQTQLNQNPNSNQAFLAVSNLLAQRKSLWAANQLSLYSAMQSVESANLNLPQIDIWQQNEVKTNAFQLKLLKELPFNASDLLALKAIAEQCPISGGDAVFCARALLAKEAPERYNDLVLCAEPAEREGTKKKSVLKSALVFPNPTSNRFYIADASFKKAELFNQLGQSILISTLSVDGFDVQKLPNGVYTLRLTDSFGAVSTEQVAIFH